MQSFFCEWMRHILTIVHTCESLTESILQNGGITPCSTIYETCSLLPLMARLLMAQAASFCVWKSLCNKYDTSINVMTCYKHFRTKILDIRVNTIIWKFNLFCLACLFISPVGFRGTKTIIIGHLDALYNFLVSYRMQKEIHLNNSLKQS